MDTTPFWLKSAATPSFSKLTRDLDVDVLVVGGGITGVTAAYLISKAGRRVALVEKKSIGGGETGHTTAHVTQMTDTRLSELVETFGRDHAQAAWEAGAAAMRQIEENVRAEEIACELRAVPGYLYAAAEADEEEVESLRAEAKLGAELGFDAAFVSDAPVVRRPALRVANQLKFHPQKYVAALAERIAQHGGEVFEGEATEFQKDPLRAQVNGHAVRFQHAIFATHVPLQGNAGLVSASLLQTKLAGYSTFAIGARLSAGELPEALFADTNDPYLYLRIDRREDCDYLILGGEDYKTGQHSDPQEHYARLERKLRALFPAAQIAERWSGQVIETNDGLPFIGETAPGQFAGTGFAGNGMTFGTLTAMMARDAVLGVKNPWTDLFSVERKKLSATWDYLKENKDFPYYLARGQFVESEKALASLTAGGGCVIRHHGEKIAVSCNDRGEICALSAVCPHLGCTVAWNDAEKTWDCPCHGSRFSATGEVIAGPAESGLEAREVGR